MLNWSLKRSDMTRVYQGITQFYLPPTHEPYLPLLPSRKASPPFGRYQLILLGEQIQIQGLDTVQTVAMDKTQIVCKINMQQQCHGHTSAQRQQSWKWLAAVSEANVASCFLAHRVWHVVSLYADACWQTARSDGNWRAAERNHETHSTV